MGNTYSKPVFDSIVQTICYLSRHTDTRTDPDSQEIPPTRIGSELFKPGEKEKKVIVNKHFGAKAIKDSFEADAVGKLIAHWSYQNEENSEIFAAVFLAGINETDYEEVAPFLTAMHHFLNLKDDLQQKRLEWLIGIPMLVDGSMIKACPPELPKLGVYGISALSDEVFYYPTTLEHVDSANESILSLIWRSRQRFENYTLFCIKELLNLGEDILKYVSNMPSPTYQYARYTDWIIQFVKDKSESKAKDSEAGNIDIATHVLLSLQKYLEDVVVYEEQLRDKHRLLYNLNDEELYYHDQDIDMKEESSNAEEGKEEDIDSDKRFQPTVINLQELESKEFKSFPKPYVIAKVFSEIETDFKQEEEMRICLSELVCEYTWNKPFGKKKTTREFFDQYKFRKTDILSWNKKIVFSKKAEDEKFVDITQSKVNKQREEEESMQQEDEETSLKPICEDYEGQEDDSSPKDRQMKPNILPSQDIDEENNQDSDKLKSSDIDTEMNKQSDEPVEDSIPELINPDEDIEDNDSEMLIEEVKDTLYETNSVVLRLSVYNFCSKKIYVQIRIRSKDNSPNFYVPECPIKAEIPANKSKTLAYFHKIHPRQPFGECFFEYVTDIHHGEPASRDQEAGNDQEKGGNSSDGDNEVKVWPAKDDDFEGMQEEITCEACTLFNPITNIKCDICGTTLPHRK
jgi:hypothetical protein